MYYRDVLRKQVHGSDHLLLSAAFSLSCSDTGLTLLHPDKQWDLISPMGLVDIKCCLFLVLLYFLSPMNV